MTMTVVVAVAGGGITKLNVGAWCSQHTQSFNFVSAEESGRTHCGYIAHSS